MPHAKCTKADHTPPAMTTNTMRVPSDRPTGTAVSAHPAAAVPGLVVPPENGAESGLAAEARLAAELAEERHVALELQRAILPLHDEPFDLPGLRTMVRYLPASRAGRVGGDWYVTADMPGGQVLIAIGDVAGHGPAARRARGPGHHRLAPGAAGRLAQRPGAPRRARAHRLGDRGLLRPAQPHPDLGPGGAPAADPGPGLVRAPAGPARGHPARRG